MDAIPGVKIPKLSPLARLELDGDRLADALFRAYLKQMLRDGLFHADPHPGNVFLIDQRIALIDLGMVARVRPALQDRLLQLLLSVSDNCPDEAVKVLLLVAEQREGADTAGFRRGVADILGQHQEVAMQRPQVGRAVLMLLKVAADHGIRRPPEPGAIRKTPLNMASSGGSRMPCSAAT